MPEREKSRRAEGQSRGSARVARPFWSGTISFGLVTIAVEMLSGVRQREEGLRWVDADGNGIRRVYYCPRDGQEVCEDDLARAYETDDGELVPLTEDELDEAAPEATREIALRRFVDREDLPLLHMERSYYLLPKGDAPRPYHLLAQTMETLGRAGLATLVMRGKEHLVAVLADRGVLRAQMLRFADAVRSARTVGLEQPAVPSDEALGRMGAAIESLRHDHLDEDTLSNPDEHSIREAAMRKFSDDQDVLRAERSVSNPSAGSGNTIDLITVLKERLAASLGVGAPRASASELKELTKDALMERARAAQIRGRSSMNKDELVAALREADESGLATG